MWKYQESYYRISKVSLISNKSFNIYTHICLGLIKEYSNMVEMVLLGMPCSLDPIWTSYFTIRRDRRSTWQGRNSKGIPEKSFWLQTWLLRSGCSYDPWVCCPIWICLCIRNKCLKLPKEMKTIIITISCYFYFSNRVWWLLGQWMNDFLVQQYQLGWLQNFEMEIHSSINMDVLSSHIMPVINKFKNFLSRVSCVQTFSILRAESPGSSSSLGLGFDLQVWSHQSPTPTLITELLFCQLVSKLCQKKKKRGCWLSISCP